MRVDDNIIIKLFQVCITTMVLFLFLSGVPAWRLMEVSAQHNGGFLPDMMLLTQCYYHRGTRLKAMKRLCFCSL